jgi:hypothetical protein
VCDRPTPGAVDQDLAKGTFSFRGTVKDVIGQKFSLTLTGKFVSRTKAKGTATLSRTSPTSRAGKKIAYTVKRQG